MSDPRPNIRDVRSPRGPELNCRSWQTEAPYRMLHNNLDSEVAEAWPIRGLPTTFVVDPEGRIAYQAVGGREWDLCSVRVYVEFRRRPQYYPVSARSFLYINYRS